MMTRAKISASVDRDLLEQAHLLTGIASISELLDCALAAFVAAEIEMQWHYGYVGAAPENVDDGLGDANYGELDLE